MSSSKGRGCALSVGNSSQVLLVPVCPTPGLCSVQNDNSKISWDICFHLCKYIGNFLPSPPGLLHTCFIRVLPWKINGWGLSLPQDQDNWVLLWCYGRLWDVYTVLRMRKTTECFTKCFTEKTNSVCKKRPGLSVYWQHVKCCGAYCQMQKERQPASVGMGIGGSAVWKLKLLLKKSL